MKRKRWQELVSLSNTARLQRNPYKVNHKHYTVLTMKNITVSPDDEMYHLLYVKAAEAETSVAVLVHRLLVRDSDDTAKFSGLDVATKLELQSNSLDEVLSDFAAQGVRLRLRDNLIREELYDEATNGLNAIGTLPKDADKHLLLC